MDLFFFTCCTAFFPVEPSSMNNLTVNPWVDIQNLVLWPPADKLGFVSFLFPNWLITLVTNCKDRHMGKKGSPCYIFTFSIWQLYWQILEACLNKYWTSTVTSIHLLLQWLPESPFYSWPCLSVCAIITNQVSKKVSKIFIKSSISVFGNLKEPICSWRNTCWKK